MLPNITAAPFQLEAQMLALSDALGAGPEPHWLGATFLKWDYNEIAGSATEDMTYDGGTLYIPVGASGELWYIESDVYTINAAGYSKWYHILDRGTAQTSQVVSTKLLETSGQPFTLAFSQVNVPPKQVKLTVANAAGTARGCQVVSKITKIGY